MIASYRELVVWQKAMDLAVAVYAATGCLPPSERFGLAAQLRRAASSIAANIAEGHARQSAREFAHFLSIALGSLAEVSTQLELAGRLQMLDSQSVSAQLDSAEHLRAMLLKLHRAVRAPKDLRDGDGADYSIEMEE